MCNSPVEFGRKALIPLNESVVSKLEICSKGEFNLTLVILIS